VNLYTDTTPTPITHTESVAEQERNRPLASCLGRGCCPQCGASTCVCAQLVNVPAGAEWWIGEDGRVVSRRANVATPA